MNRAVQQLGEYSPFRMPIVLPMDEPAPHAKQQKVCKDASQVLLTNAPMLAHSHAIEEVAEVDQCLKRAQNQKNLQSKEAMQKRDLYADAVTYYDSKSMAHMQRMRNAAQSMT